MARLVADSVDLYLKDVRTMLRTPQPGLAMPGGLGHAIAEVLCGTLSGVSRVFFPSDGSERAFRSVLAFYPPEAPPAIAGQAFEDEMYVTYRCNLVHSLGLNVVQVGRSWQVASFAQPTKIIRYFELTGAEQVGLTEPRIDELEDLSTRPTWLPATLSRDGGVQRLCLESLYWGTRVLVAKIAADPARAAIADGLLTAQPVAPRFGPPVIGPAIPPGSPFTQVGSSAASMPSQSSWGVPPPGNKP